MRGCIASRNSRTLLDPEWVTAASSIELAPVVDQILAVVTLVGIAAVTIPLVYRHVSDQRDLTAEFPLSGND